MSRAATTLLCATLLMAGSAAFGQKMLSPIYGTYGAPMSNYLTSSYLLNQAALGVVNPGGASSNAGDAPMYFPANLKPIAPRKLAAAYPEGRRGEAEKLFQGMLDGYRKLEAKFGLRPNDVSGAMAAFLVGNYIAYHDAPFPDAQFKPLANQLHQRISGTPAMRKASETDLQEMYEQLAILGMYMAVTREALAKTPDPKLKAEMQRAAGNYLQQFLRIDPDRVRIGPEGLSVR